MRRMSALEVDAHLKQANGKPLILDIREPWEYAVCRIDGSELVPMRQISTALSQLDPEQETIVVCHHGIRSFSVCRYLEQMGFTKLINLEGGVAAWARDVDAEMATY